MNDVKVKMTFGDFKTSDVKVKTSDVEVVTSFGEIKTSDVKVVTDKI